MTIRAWAHCAFAPTQVGIHVPPARALELSPEGHTFLSQRFDRTRTGGRLAFVSAMTFLQRMDGESGASYLELIA